MSDTPDAIPPQVARRLTRLEEKLAYQEETIAQLDGVVCDLSARMRKLTDQMADLRELATPLDLNRTAEDDLPPHSARREG